MAETPRLRVAINPDNLHVSINDPGYQESWITAFEKVRAETEARIHEEVSEGTLEVEVDPADPIASTQGEVIHWMAHMAAEQSMQDWAILRGIGLVAPGSVWDHGRVITYELDPEVPFLEHRILEETPVTA